MAGIVSGAAKAAGNLVAPHIVQAVERYGNPSGGQSRLGLLGKDLLKAAFPQFYLLGSKISAISKSRDKKSAVTESVTELSAEVVQTNNILTTSIEIQVQQNAILSEILKAVKDSKGTNLKDVMDGMLPSPKGAAAKKPSAAKKPGTAAKKPGSVKKPQSKLGKISTSAKVVAKTAGKAASAIPALSGIVSGGLEFAESGNVGRAAAVGAGAMAGAAAGALTGAAFGSLIPVPVVGTVLGGVLGFGLSLAGGYYGEQLGRNIYDKATEKNKNQATYEAESITYAADDIKFNSKQMLLKAKQLTIAGDIAGLNLQPSGVLASLLPQVAPEDINDRNQMAGDIRTRMRRSTPGTGSLEGFNITPGIDTRVDKSIIDKLTQLKSSVPAMTITSGYRDPARNAAAGGAGGSQHLQGNAVDISFPANAEETLRVIEAASAAGVGGIGVYGPGKLHLDTGSRRAWGPSYKFESVPEWALPAIQKHLGLKGYADGTPYVPKTGPAIVGERGAETIISSGKATKTKGGAHVVNLKQGDAVIPAEINPVSAFFNELTSPITGNQVPESAFISKVVGGKADINDAGVFAAKAAKGFAPVDLDRVGGTVKSLARGDVAGAAGQAVRAIPFGNFIADTITNAIPESTPARPPAPTPTVNRAPAPNNYSDQQQAPAGRSPQQTNNKMKKAEAPQQDQTNSLSMLKTMFGNAA